MKQKKFIIISGISVFCLCLCIVLSISYGVKSVGIGDVWDAIRGIHSDKFEVGVVTTRIPRTVFGILGGAALAISGAIMQAITRNPIADPSILGVNTGASLFVVCGIAFFHIHNGNQYIWLAFLGAFLTALFVYRLAASGYGGVTPMKLAISGAITATALQALVNTIMLPNSQVMDQFRFWQVGSIGGVDWEEIMIVLPYMLVGFCMSILLATSFNTLALGDEVATGLGLNVFYVRALGALAGVLLCASTTALAGPIGFIGLMVPHLVRLLIGSDMRKMIPISAVLGSCVLILADVAGRLLGKPAELESGIITALVGAPVFISIIRKGKVRSL